ncbi:sugar transporter [Malikia spinosa]|uniref:Sugar transporter n=1 Tax=Malikia spinosa TaxID=86180 RepID=A0A2S9KA48_9BURK|nr:polysaccharide biosynthesis/export family protein [Malikia spinosa]PRD67321.1 sugar transporter [Malikia spinosa]
MNPPQVRHPASTRALLAGLALSLGGCAMAPGMYVGKQGAVEAPKRTTLLNVLNRPVEPVTVAGPADTAPPGAITPITPALIQQQRAARRDEVPADVQALFAAPKTYTIGAGDVLNIVVWDHPELAITPAGGLGTDAGSLSGIGNGYNVSPQGLIQFPYVGTLKLAGLNEYEARELITERLAKYIKNPQVTVRIQSYRSGRVYLDGEIRSPGLQALNEIPMTLPEAIGRAGGFTATADRASIALSRNGKTTLINLAQLIERGINPSRILLAHGDMVRVLGREEAKVFVLGEVLRPNSQPLRNGRLTLNEALSDSGGVNPISADPRQIFVVRTQNPEKPEIFHLDAQSPVAYALAEGFELKARDVVYVDPVPLVRWNRVISLILPSAQAVNVTRDATTAK